MTVIRRRDLQDTRSHFGPKAIAARRSDVRRNQWGADERARKRQQGRQMFPEHPRHYHGAGHTRPRHHLGGHPVKPLRTEKRHGHHPLKIIDTKDGSLAMDWQGVFNQTLVFSQSFSNLRKIGWGGRSCNGAQRRPSGALQREGAFTAPSRFQRWCGVRPWAAAPWGWSSSAGPLVPGERFPATPWRPSPRPADCRW